MITFIDLTHTQQCRRLAFLSRFKLAGQLTRVPRRSPRTQRGRRWPDPAAAPLSEYMFVHLIYGPLRIKVEYTPQWTKCFDTLCLISDDKTKGRSLTVSRRSGGSWEFDSHLDVFDSIFSVKSRGDVTADRLIFSAVIITRVREDYGMQFMCMWGDTQRRTGQAVWQ